MDSRNLVEIADRNSRRRAIIVVAGAIVFIAGQALGGPAFRDNTDRALYNMRNGMWALNVVLLLAFLATGGGLLNNPQIRALVNDEVSRANYRTSVIAGFWVAMTSALVLYLVPVFAALTGKQTLYLVLTPSVAVASLTFAYLELRAHRDA